MGYARLQLTDFDTQGAQAAERLFAMSFSGLLIAALIIGHPIRRLPVVRHPGRGRQVLGLQPGVGGFAHLFYGQVQRHGRFFL